ncbi:MAG: amidohydrolase, partial [Clostridiales bacterium]|nr:amidohydrolase [Clostridiales bacterium]
ADKNYDSGDILIQDGKIVKVGENITAPDGVHVINAKGLWALPGFVDAHCHVGMFEDKMGFEGEDGNEAVEPVTSELRAIDAINPADYSFKEAYEHGVTSVCTGPGSANVIGGQFVAMKTYGRRVDDMIIKEPLAVKVAFGENPKRVYSGQDKSPTTRMATASMLRQALINAMEYKKKIDETKIDDDAKMPERELSNEILVDLLERKLVMKAHCHRADDIFTAIRIAKEFNLDYSLEHCTEGHLVVDLLKEENAKCILGPLLSARSKIELENLSFKAPGIFEKAGVKFAQMTDHPVIPLHYLPVCAALSVREGCSEDTALKSITIHAAEITGINDRVGSIEVGKDADIALFDAHPFDYLCHTKKVFIDGAMVFNSDKK